MIIAINQNNRAIFLEGKAPLKELQEKVGGGKPAKIFRDDEQGHPYHIGYIIGTDWWTFYNASEWRRL